MKVLSIQLIPGGFNATVSCWFGLVTREYCCPNHAPWHNIADGMPLDMNSRTASKIFDAYELKVREQMQHAMRAALDQTARLGQILYEIEAGKPGEDVTWH